MKVSKNITVKQLQEFILYVYGRPDSRYFEIGEVLINMNRFIMRGLKGIRQNNQKRTIYNLLLSMSWFFSILNLLHIDLQEEVWNRFPGICSYCGTCPCKCKLKKIKKRVVIHIKNKSSARTLSDFQQMFERIYPHQNVTLEHLGVHLVEESGELSEAIMFFRGKHKDEDFIKICHEAADLFSCLMSIFNYYKISTSEELTKIYYDNCHVCHKAPCTCSFNSITKFRS